MGELEEQGMKRKEEGEEEEERGEGSSVLNDGLVRWENLLPKMVLRVLLVEADDSTRQIIAALLRKCSYKVAAVADGLKAWEVLKGRPHDIDLILTEVELPSISGYPLLTLITEHDVCKNIPVIMMSSQDSISTVYKYMLRGAADYLVKPIRRNELRNLWQHVWRRQSSVGGSFPLDESTGQDKAEGTSENNAASNNTSGDVGGIQRGKEYIEKGSDDQSSCTKPEMEAGSVQVEDQMDVQMREKHISASQKFSMGENNPGGNVSFVMVDDNADAESQGLKDVEASEGHGNNNVMANASREAIDFMGTSNYESSSNNANCELQSSPHLDLTLRGSHFGGTDNQILEDRNMLRHSSASAFTRYSSKVLQPFFPAFSSVYQNEPRANSDAQTPTNDGAQMSSTVGQAPNTQRSSLYHGTGQTKEFEHTTCLQHGVIPIQAPLESMTIDKLCSSYGSVFPPMYCKQSSASPTPGPSSAGQRESAPRASGYHYTNFDNNISYLQHCPSRNTNDSTNQNSQKEQELRLETPEDNGHISPATDQSATSSFCNGALSRINSMGRGSACGSTSNLDQVAPGRATADSKNEENVFGHNQNCHRSIQREAALTKFRLKRKERCFEKKVRYESRKKLAEKRPRVKGQFVRQLQVDLLS